MNSNKKIMEDYWNSSTIGRYAERNIEEDAITKLIKVNDDLVQEIRFQEDRWNSLVKFVKSETT